MIGSLPRRGDGTTLAEGILFKRVGAIALADGRLARSEGSSSPIRSRVATTIDPRPSACCRSVHTLRPRASTSISPNLLRPTSRSVLVVKMDDVAHHVMDGVDESDVSANRYVRMMGRRGRQAVLQVRRYVVSLPAKVRGEWLTRCEPRLLFGRDAVLRSKAPGRIAFMLVVPVAGDLTVVVIKLRVVLSPSARRSEQCDGNSGGIPIACLHERRPP